MRRRGRPEGREHIVAGAALETLTQTEARETETNRAADLPGLEDWRTPRRGVIRLINLERRARFARLAVETN